jgi:hypothetical protein
MELARDATDDDEDQTLQVSDGNCATAEHPAPHHAIFL